MVTTYPGFRFKYGYVQVIARIPNDPGLWPALWLAAANLHWPPEMDMLEHKAPLPVAGVFFHPVGSHFVGLHLHIARLADKWHTFALSWTAKKAIFYVDGIQVLRIDKRVPHQLMYFIANLAVWRSPGRSGCHGAMAIRSVKVWQRISHARH